MQNSTLYLAFDSFALFEEHFLSVTVQDYHTLDNKTEMIYVTNAVILNATGEDIPSDLMINMDDANVTSRQVVVEFSSLFRHLSRNAEVAAGFQMKYEYLNSSEYKSRRNFFGFDLAHA